MKWKFENGQVINPKGEISDTHRNFSDEDKKKWVERLNYDLEKGFAQTWQDWYNFEEWWKAKDKPKYRK